MMGHMFICVDRDRNYISFCEKNWKNRDKLVQIGQNDDIFVQIFGFCDSIWIVHYNVSYLTTTDYHLGCCLFFPSFVYK